MLSIYRSIDRSIDRSIHPSINPSIPCINASMHARCNRTCMHRKSCCHHFSGACASIWSLLSEQAWHLSPISVARARSDGQQTHPFMHVAIVRVCAESRFAILSVALARSYGHSYRNQLDTFPQVQWSLHDQMVNQRINPCNLQSYASAHKVVVPSFSGVCAIRL